MTITWPLPRPYSPTGYVNQAGLDTAYADPMDALYALIRQPAVSWLGDSDGGSIPNGTTTGTGISSYNMGEIYSNDPLGVLSHTVGVQTLGKLGVWDFEGTLGWSGVAGAIAAHHRGLYAYHNGSTLPLSDGASTMQFAAAASGGLTATNQSIKGSVLVTDITDTLQLACFQNSGASLGYESAVFKVSWRC